MDIAKLFQCVFYLHVVIVIYLCTDICECMTAPLPQKPINNYPGLSLEELKSTSIDSSMITTSSRHDNDKTYYDKAALKILYQVHVISDISADNEGRFNGSDGELFFDEDLETINGSSYKDQINNQLARHKNEAIPTSLCYLCTWTRFNGSYNGSNVASFIKSSNLSQFYEGMIIL